MATPKHPGLYQENLERFKKVIRSEPVDRIPVVMAGSAASARYLGVSMADYASDMKVQRKVAFDFLEKLGGIDGVNVPATGAPFDVVLGSLWLSKILMPGRELPPDSLWQVEEKEQMLVEDYDVIIDKGWAKFQSKLLSKILQDPRGFTKFIIRTILATPGTNRKFRNAGIVPLCGAIGTFPFESLCGARSMSQFFFDLFRMPDKVEAAMDVMLPDMIKTLLQGGKGSGALGVWVGGWRSAGSFLNQKQWDRFVFPYMMKMTEAVAEAGLVPILHIDQDWTRDLERFKEFPAKTCLLNPDGMTDIRAAKKILDGHMAIMGDVPASLFAAGTPEDIRNYIRDLIRDIGPEGLILCPGCDAPINSKPENLEAFVAAGKEFGVVG
jgi:uroporphyrinogen-III decarboxylase